ncbi:hypothetical protein CK203_072188 [Vitis vinifera]|uniref:Uncharacterized protein n=1 Tax=Vitis vinifera TaxID=29760 RepID=A0A438BUX8_VITVI|nr:hypothetical protein CK203_072188 [Vitis vinifera]
MVFSTCSKHFIQFQKLFPGKWVSWLKQEIPVLHLLIGAAVAFANLWREWRRTVPQTTPSARFLSIDDASGQLNPSQHYLMKQHDLVPKLECHVHIAAWAVPAWWEWYTPETETSQGLWPNLISHGP